MRAETKMLETTASLTTVTFFGYRPSERFWAFNRMGSARALMARTPGLRFWRLLGTGRGKGFSLRPDFSRYGLLAVWESAEAFETFYENSSLMRSYREHAREIWNARLLPLQAHGSWKRVNPFTPSSARPTEPGRPVAVLTRASIRLRRLAAFWRAVPSTSRALERAPGLLASTGTGEWPFTHPATFSLWRDEAAMSAFAYGDPAHAEVMRRRRDERWYGEELFARFIPVASEGSWDGRDPLEGLL